MTLNFAASPAKADDTLPIAPVLDIFADETYSPDGFVAAFDTLTNGAISAQIIPDDGPNEQGIVAVFIDILDGDDVIAVTSCNWRQSPAETETLQVTIDFGSDIAAHFAQPFDPLTTTRVDCMFLQFTFTRAYASDTVASVTAWADPRVAPMQSQPNNVYAQSYLSLSDTQRQNGELWAVWVSVSAGEDLVGTGFSTIIDLHGPAPLG